MERIAASDRTGLARWGVLLALVLAAITVAQQAAWVHLDATRTRDDDARLHAMSLCLADVLSADSPDHLTACLQPTPYPPLVPLVAAIHFLLAGDRSIDMAVQSLWVWYVVLVLFLYQGVRAEAGVLAGLTAAALGPVVANAHFLRGAFYTEVPLMALTVASVVCLVNSRGFRSPAWSAALGVMLGAGLMVKWTFAFFLAPPMIVAVAVALARIPRDWRGRVLVASGSAVAIAAFGAWAAGMWPAGGVVSAVAAIVTAGVVGGSLARSTGKPESWRILVGLGLTLAGVVVVAGPWYVATLSQVRDFLASNLTMRYDGEHIPWTRAWHYYPAVLLTRSLGTPLGVLFLAGAIRTLFPGRSKLAAWSLAAFVSGLIFLTLSPYRTARYLAAGYGLIVPVAVPWMPRWPRLRVPLYATMLFCGLFAQLSWIPPEPGSVAVPIPAWLNTPPPRELFGNIRGGMQQAWHDLRHPRWHMQAFAPMPIRDVSPAKNLLAAISAYNPPGEPFSAAMWDPDGRGNADALRIAALAAGFPESTRVQRQPVPADSAQMAAQVFQLRTSRPRGARDLSPPLFIITLTDVADAARERPILQRLQRAGFRVVCRNLLDNVGTYVFRVWVSSAPRHTGRFGPAGP